MLCAIGVHAQKLKINTVPEGLQKAYLDGKDTVPIVNLRKSTFTRRSSLKTNVNRHVTPNWSVT